MLFLLFYYEYLSIYISVFYLFHLNLDVYLFLKLFLFLLYFQGLEGFESELLVLFLYLVLNIVDIGLILNMLLIIYLI